MRCTAAAGDGQLSIEVADSGPGVPATEREAIFERFHQVSGARHRRPGGTGLGLAIVRELVTLLGGTVTAGEAPEGGALLRVTLPHEPAVATPAPGRRALGPNVAEHERATLEALRLDLEALDRRDARRRPAADGLPRVLLVEPGPTLAVYLEELLGADYDVRRAATADEALRIARATPVDAVLVDVAGAGGEALLGAVRVPALAGVPFVILAGDPEQAQLLVRDRADDYAVKPFAETLLVRLGSSSAGGGRVGAREADARFHAVFEHAPNRMRLATTEGRCSRSTPRLARCSACRATPARPGPR